MVKMVACECGCEGLFKKSLTLSISRDCLNRLLVNEVNQKRETSAIVDLDLERKKREFGLELDLLIDNY